ncbi:hypothetical protein KAR91_35060 [Candidatus Pacearchaeota archaeon]|nr:hypothetical protein [Candidatus Pacearchaeota archaeon]
MEPLDLVAVKSFEGLDGGCFVIFVFYDDGFYVPEKFDCSPRQACSLVYCFESKKNVSKGGD